MFEELYFIFNHTQGKEEHIFLDALRASILTGGCIFPPDFSMHSVVDADVSYAAASGGRVLLQL